MDEFDLLINDAPLYNRVSNKSGYGSNPGFNVGASNERNIDRLILTPPPPATTSTSYENSSRDRASALQSIDNLLDPKRKADNGLPAGKRRKQPPGAKPAANKRGTADEKRSKEYKEAEKIFNKQTDKTEVNKYILVIIDPEVVSSPPGAEIINLLSNPPSGKEEEVFRYKVVNQMVPASLTWKRKLLYLNCIDGQPVTKEEWIDEQRTMLFAAAEDIADKILTGSFQTWAQNIKNKFGDLHHITLIIYNYNNYIKADKNAQERARKAAIRGESAVQRGRSGDRVGEYQFQEALLTLSINGTMDYITSDKATDKGWRDCAANVFHATRAIAEAPDKLKKNISSSAGFEFYAKADVKDSISPKNLLEYWKQVLMQITVMSLEKASSIVQKYPSPTSLIEAYSRCDSVQEAEVLLANLEIRRADTIVGGTRRLGDEISRKIYHALTSADPVSLLSKN